MGLVPLVQVRDGRVILRIGGCVGDDSRTGEQSIPKQSEVTYNPVFQALRYAGRLLIDSITSCLPIHPELWPTNGVR